MMAITTSSSTSVNARRSSALSTEENEDMTFSGRTDEPGGCPLHRRSGHSATTFHSVRNTPRPPRFAEREHLASPAPLLLFPMGNSLTLAGGRFKFTFHKTA